MTLPPARDDVMGLAEGFAPVAPDAWADLAAAVVNKSRPDDRKVDAAGAREALSSHLPGGIDIDLASGVRLSVDSYVNEKALARVLRALREAS